MMGPILMPTPVKWNFQQFIDAKRTEVTGLTSMDVVDDSTIRLNFSAWNNSFYSSVPLYQPDDIAHRIPEEW